MPLDELQTATNPRRGHTDVGFDEGYYAAELGVRFRTGTELNGPDEGDVGDSGYFVPYVRSALHHHTGTIAEEYRDHHESTGGHTLVAAVPVEHAVIPAEWAWAVDPVILRARPGQWDAGTEIGAH